MLFLSCFVMLSWSKFIFCLSAFSKIKINSEPTFLHKESIPCTWQSIQFGFIKQCFDSLTVLT